MSEKFNLTWHTFASHGQDLFRNLFETQEFSDVTLVSDDHHQYKVHKFILSACSTVFKNILNSNSLNTLIYLRGIKHEELESILQFIYLGEATLYNERMSEFLNVAKNLDIKEVGKNVVDDEDDELKNSINLEQADPEVIDKDHSNTKSTAKQRSRNSGSNSSDSIIAGKKLYKCEKCCFQTKHNSNLHKHVRSKHNGKEYLCQQCDYQTTRSDTLQLHIDSKHMGIKYPCQQCNYIANFPSTLYCHVKAKHISV